MLHALYLILLPAFCLSILPPSFNKTHQHHGILKSYNGRQLSYKLMPIDRDVLDKGKPFIAHKPNAKSDRQGLASVIQDINAPPYVCLQKILDFSSYPRYVPLLKSIDIYNTEKFPNGTEITLAYFNTRVLAMKFGYYLRLVRHPADNTVTWTLDYDHKSDVGRSQSILPTKSQLSPIKLLFCRNIDDNVGMWQVMTHPTKRQWTRVLYSTGVLLPKLIPSFVINHILKTGLVEATTWLKKESEKFVHDELAAGRNVFAGSGGDVSLFSHQNDDGSAIGVYAEDSVSGVGVYTPNYQDHIAGNDYSHEHEHTTYVQEEVEPQLDSTRDISDPVVPVSVADKELEGKIENIRSSSKGFADDFHHHGHGHAMGTGDASSCPFARKRQKKVEGVE